MKDHKQKSEQLETIQVAVITVSDTRTFATDKAGPLAAQLLSEAGHEVVHTGLVPDDPAQIESVLFQLLGGSAACIIFTGGTGISPRDHTLDTIAPLFNKEMDGFGELFRWLSYQEIGTSAMLSRAAAGVVRGHFVVCLPGSPKAVELAMRSLILPELKHVLWQLQ